MPLREGFGDFKVPRLRTQLVNHLQTKCARTDIVFPHVESELHLPPPEIREFALHDIKLTILRVFKALVEHPLFKLAIENESFSMSLSVKLGNLSILLEKHHGVAGEFEPHGEAVLLLLAIAVEDQVSQPVDRTKLVDIATSNPQGLVEGSLLGAIECFLQSLFKLSGR